MRKFTTLSAEVPKKRRRRRKARAAQAAPATPPRPKNGTSVDKRVVSGLKDLARLAEEDPEAFRAKAAEFVERTEIGLGKFAVFLENAKRSPTIRRGIENFVLREVAQKISRDLDEEPSNGKKVSKSAEEYLRGLAESFRQTKPGP